MRTIFRLHEPGRPVEGATQDAPAADVWRLELLAGARDDRSLVVPVAGLQPTAQPTRRSPRRPASTRDGPPRRSRPCQPDLPAARSQPTRAHAAGPRPRHARRPCVPARGRSAAGRRRLHPACCPRGGATAVGAWASGCAFDLARRRRERLPAPASASMPSWTMTGGPRRRRGTRAPTSSTALAGAKTGLVRVRGEWVEIDPGEIAGGAPRRRAIDVGWRAAATDRRRRAGHDVWASVRRPAASR